MPKNNNSNKPNGLQYSQLDSKKFNSDFWRWIIVAFIVLLVYLVAFIGFYFYSPKEERLAGGTPVLMIDFAPQATAPPVENEAETVKSEKTPEPDEVLNQQTENTVEPETTAKPVPQAIQKTEKLPTTYKVKTENSIQNTADKVKKTAHKKENKKKTSEKREKDKVRPKHQKRQRVKDKPHKPRRKKTERGNQRASAPNTLAKAGRKFAAPKTNKHAGFNGRSQKNWEDLAYVRIRTMARRMEDQLPGARGITYVSFSYNQSGKITATRVTKSSGSDKIDRLAIRIVKASSPLPRPPQIGVSTVPIKIN